MAEPTPVAALDSSIDALFPDLDCPACGVDLEESTTFQRYRVCPNCDRHFGMTARERLVLLVDSGSFTETDTALAALDPLRLRDRLPVPDRLAEAQERTGLTDAVITGTGLVGSHSLVLIVLDEHLLGGSIGAIAGEKIILAIELAAARRLPLLAVCAGGAARIQEGMLSLVQLAKIAAAATRLHRDGVLFISLLTHPTMGGVYTGLANQADLILAEPGAQVGHGTVRSGDRPRIAPGETAEAMLAHGMVDHIVGRVDLRQRLTTLLDLFAQRGMARPRGLAGPATPEFAGRATWDETALARHPDRPTARDYLERLIPDLVEVHGDRNGADDRAVICGLGRFDGLTVAVVAQERGRGAEERGRCHEGRMASAGYRKAMRLMRLAGHLELPILTMIDTPGVDPGEDGQEFSVGMALAQTFALMSLLPVPIVSVTIGEGGGAGGLALGAGDRILMQEHAVYTVISPEGAAPRRPTGPEGRGPGARLCLTARECLRLGVLDALVAEPIPGAHADPDGAAEQLREAVIQAYAELAGSGPRRLLDDRARKIRTMGWTTPEGREATRREITDLQELQRTLASSLHDLRDRWEQRHKGLPRRALPRPSLTDLAGRIAARRTSTTPARIPAEPDAPVTREGGE